MTLTIDQCLGKKPRSDAVSSELRSLHREMVRAKQRYSGGLSAEKQSLDRLLENLKLKARQAVLSRMGWKIDLEALLKERRADGHPTWALVDPNSPISWENGQYTPQSAVSKGKEEWGFVVRSLHMRPYKGNGRWYGTTGTKAHYLHVDLPLKEAVTPSGMPALPPKVRALSSDPKIRRRAKWVGVLYQPEEWHVGRPDPALVVEWWDLPGEYYALAVWGNDRPRIMEFTEPRKK